MKPIDNSQLLAQMKSMAQAAGIPPVEPSANFTTSNVKAGGFSNLLVRAIDNVNATQKHSSMLATKIETGDGGASLVQAMIASQKSSISFQAVMQVRNKVASAYKDIMSMPL
jgi:flagellar hook-basal body complex protein FliE